MPRDGYRIGYWASSPATGRITTIQDPLWQPDGTRTDTLDIVVERNVHGVIVDTLARLPSRYTFYSGGPDRFRYYYVTAWWQRPWDDGVLIARTDQYRFLWYGPDGALSRIVSLAREPHPITEEDRSVLVGRWEATFRENRVPAERAGELLSGIKFADNYPPFCRFSYGPAGTLLVQRVLPVRELAAEEQKEMSLNSAVPPGRSEWDVFDSEGRYLGGVVIPESEFTGTGRFFRFFRDRATGKWYMYSIWSDDLDVEYIVRWRIDGRMPDESLET